MQLALQQGGPADRALADGSTSWNQVAAAALTEWNQYLATLQFNPVSDSTASPNLAASADSSDGVNSAVWSNTVFGEGWGSAIGLTFRFYYTTTSLSYLQQSQFYPTIEADVLFNNTITWDSYRGPMRATATDFRRVALHEFGHVLGLDHPDDHQQAVSADMNAMVSNLDDITADDIGGVQNLYDDTSLAIVTQPQSAGFATGSTATLTAVTANDHEAAFQWYKNGQAYGALNTTGTGGILAITNAQPSDSGAYTLTVTNRAGTVTSNAATLSIGTGPQLTATPQSQTASAGGTVTLSVAAASSSGLIYQWFLNGNAIAGANGSSLTLTNIGVLDAGQYSVGVSNGTITTTSPSAMVSVTTNARLANLSTLANAGSGSNGLTAGFTIGGSGKKTVLIRGIGPALSDFGLSGVMSFPQLVLDQTVDGSPRLLTSCTQGWCLNPISSAATLAQAFASVGAFGLQTGSNDEAILGTLDPANGLTATVTSPDASSGGLALVEVWDEDSTSSTSRLTNLSVLAQSGPGANLLTAGFLVQGSTSQTVLVRGDGPALSGFGVANALNHPILTLVRQADGAVLATNAGWNNDSRLAAAFTATGAFPFTANSADAAIVVTLPPGLYSASVGDTNNSSGAALIEVYEMR